MLEILKDIRSGALPLDEIPDFIASLIDDDHAATFFVCAILFVAIIASLEIAYIVWVFRLVL